MTASIPTPTGRRRRSRGRPTREDAGLIEDKLYATALREFLRHGYGGTSMARIVKEAQISKTTLYTRFPSKEALFRAIMHQQIESLAVSTSLSPYSPRSDLKGGLISYAKRALEISSEGDLLGVNRLIYSESHRFPELGAAADERTQVGVQQIAEFIQMCAEAEGVPCRDPRGAAEAFISMLRGWYVNIILTGRKASKSEREEWVTRAVHFLLSDRSKW